MCLISRILRSSCMLNTGSLTIQRQMANSWLLHCSQVSERAGLLHIIIQQIPRQGDGTQPRLVSIHFKVCIHLELIIHTDEFGKMQLLSWEEKSRLLVKNNIWIIAFATLPTITTVITLLKCKQRISKLIYLIFIELDREQRN